MSCTGQWYDLSFLQCKWRSVLLTLEPLGCKVGILLRLLWSWMAENVLQLITTTAILHVFRSKRMPKSMKWTSRLLLIWDCCLSQDFLKRLVRDFLIVASSKYKVRYRVPLLVFHPYELAELIWEETAFAAMYNPYVVEHHPTLIKKILSRS